MDLTLNVPSIDQEMAVEGVWIDYAPGISFLIARNGNPEYKKAIQAVYKVNKTFIDNKTLSDEQSDAMLVNVLSKYIVLDWKGLTNAGEEFPYSVEAAKELLGDAKYSELRTWIVSQSNEVENYRAEEQKK